MRTTLARSPSSQSGQVMPLAAIAMITLALVVFLTLNIQRTVHEKIRLQNYSDAQAYSMAVQEARTLNYIAMSNRAIANAYVEMATLDAYMTEAAMTADMDEAMMVAMGEISAIEYGICCSCPFGICCNIPHCIHGFEADFNAFFYFIDWISGTLGNDIKQLDGPYHNAISAIDAQITMLHTSEEMMVLAMGLLLTNATSISELNTLNLGSKSPGGSVGVGALSAVSFTKALNMKSLSTKAKEMAGVVDATRPPFTWDRTGVESTVIPDVILAPMINTVQSQAVFGGFNFTTITEVPNLPFLWSGGRSGMGDGPFPGFYGMAQDFAGSTSQTEGKAIASYDWGEMTTSWKDGIGTAPLNLAGFLTPGTLIQGSTGEHDLGMITFCNPVHQGGSHTSPAIAPNNSWIEYNISDQSADRFNQPVVYFGGTSDLRSNDLNQKGPWEISPNGPIQIDVGGSDGKGSVTLYDGNPGEAISKAMVYYHRLGDWNEMPNLFNPYWRARLDSFDSSTEAAEVAAAIGDVSAGVLIKGVGALSPGAINSKAP